MSTELYQEIVSLAYLARKRNDKPNPFNGAMRIW